MFAHRLYVQGFNLPYMHLGCLRPKHNIIEGLVQRVKISYVVTLPDIPSDTAETNPLLRDSDLPDLNVLTHDTCYRGLSKHCLNYESEIWKIEEKLEDGSMPRTFSNITNELAKLDAPLSYAWSTVKTFYSVKNNELNSESYLKLHERAKWARHSKFRSDAIYGAFKEINAKEMNIGPVQKRVIQKVLLEGRLNGMEIQSQKQKDFLSFTLKSLELRKTHYRLNLKVASKSFAYRIIDPDIVRDFPDYLLQYMSSGSKDHVSGPWTVTHHPFVYDKFLEHCSHKDLRYNAWKSFARRCSHDLVPDLSNSRMFEDIRDFRLDQAKVFGFRHYADFSMETKMAGSVENVLSMIECIAPKAKVKQQEEMASLKEYAHANGFRGELEEYDIPYWRREQLDSILKSGEIDKCFPLDHVWPQLLAFCSNLFGIHFEEVAPDSVPRWHPDVRFYNILDSNGGKMSSFYIDLYTRPQEKPYSPETPGWVVPLKSNCEIANTSPVASLIFNFPERSPESGTSFLSLSDVNTLFSQFGYALPHLLSTVPYGETSGLKNIEWDAVDVCSNFLSNWLDDPSVLEKISKHHESGRPLDRDGIQCVLKARSHLAAHDMCYELYLSHYDLALNTENNDHWRELMIKVWDAYLPYKMHDFNSLPCWFIPFTQDVWAASYYSNVWAKMIAADVFAAFKECDPQEIPAVGKRYRDTYLSIGGGYHASDVFRSFRGRDPSAEALAMTYK